MLRECGSDAILSVRAAQVSDESPQHVSKVLVEARNSDFLFARDVLSFQRGGQMSACLQSGAAGDSQVMREVTVGALAESFCNVARNLSGGLGQLLMQIEISDQFR